MSKSLVRPFKCSTCSRPFTRQENLKRHVQTHHPSAASRSYPCPQCDARFSRSDLRKRHIRNCHPSIEMMLPVVPWQSIEDEYFLPCTQTQDDDDVHLILGLSRLPVKKATPESQYCEAFFKKFHPTMPMLHEPSFVLGAAPKALLTAVTCIGSLYSASDFRFSASRKLFEEGYHELEEHTKEDRSRFQETWVLQAYILLEVYGIYVCDDSLLSKAQHIHHCLVGAIRDLQMTHDGHASRLDTPESPELAPIMAGDDPPGLQKRWLDFIQEESRKRCIYSIYLLDCQLAIACNLRPQISALEIKYELPCADDLWSAPTAEAWSTTASQHFRSFNEQDDAFATDDALPSTGSLYGSTQGLLHPRPSAKSGGPSPPLKLLWYSPFAALVLVTQLQMMARELTHASCLLSRPAKKTAPRHLSILTEAQYGQISQALRNIAELIPRCPPSASTTTSSCAHTNAGGGDGDAQASAFAPLWHSFWLTWRYTSITLSHSDSLLVTGVVETNLPAAIATAGHLARPRRKEKRDIYEDRDVFRILTDLEAALARIGKGPAGGEGMEDALSLENPFLTLLSFKICLVGWRIVRLTMAEAVGMGPGASVAAADAAIEGVGMARYNPARFVLRSIMAAIGDEKVDGGRAAAAAQAEVGYLQWVKKALLRRSAWPIGMWEAAIVEEAAAEAANYVEALGECGSVL